MNPIDRHRMAQACGRLRADHNFKELMLLIENRMEEQDDTMRKTNDPEAWRKAQGYRMGLQELIDFVHNENAPPVRSNSREHF